MRGRDRRRCHATRDARPAFVAQLPVRRQAAQAAAPQVQSLAANGPLADYLAPLAGALAERPGQLIIVPLRNRQQELVGALALLIVEDAKQANRGVSAELLAFIAALSGTSAVSIENQRLLHAQKNLFAAFIRLLADAIERAKRIARRECARRERRPDGA